MLPIPHHLIQNLMHRSLTGASVTDPVIPEPRRPAATRVPALARRFS